MTRVLSCIQPTGDVHLGNYLGALNPWVANQHNADAFHGIVDLHSLTAVHDAAILRRNVTELATMLFAIGLDPDAATVFVQSHVPEHAQLCWLMECIVSVGELSRMVQYKEKSAKSKGFIPAGLLTYPALQVADILLYDANEVPVGADQRQHIELTRDAAIRFNSRYGDTFVVPKFVAPTSGARVMDLQDPSSKMSKSTENQNGCVYLLDTPGVILKKFKRAVTDSDNEVFFDQEKKPGISNLLEILAACTGEKPEVIAEGFTQYGTLKTAAGEAVIELLRPVQARYAELAADPTHVASLLHLGATKARAVASVTLQRAYRAAGLLPA
jgi:tryptophanyl-tRNA synthetase